MRGSRQNPFSIFQIAKETIATRSTFYIESAVGIFGWLDTPMPKWYYLAMIAAISIATIAHIFEIKTNDKPLQLSLFSSCVIYSAAVFASLYLYYTPVGAPAVYGVQGRYLLVSAIILSVATPSIMRGHQSMILTVPVIWLIQLICAIESFRVIVFRYYLS
ncbi:putative membrane protein [Paenochrobactrum gallinarii]|uniref:Putative membrane protein n=1 Tax=Paenochrobactrum gallinarii TaxID=643673 RepID=A0A841M1K7_9HYPH|nr:putative membrane protein [Paenochrobactrum gallinarii]